jgi:hypothetical protein
MLWRQRTPLIKAGNKLVHLVEKRVARAEPLMVKKQDSVEVSESETFASYDDKLREKYGDNWLGKGKCTGLEFKRWLALRDNMTEIP